MGKKGVGGYERAIREGQGSAELCGPTSAGGANVPGGQTMLGEEKTACNGRRAMRLSMNASACRSGNCAFAVHALSVHVYGQTEWAKRLVHAISHCNYVICVDACVADRGSLSSTGAGQNRRRRGR
jgi:hypothetical protein